MSKKYDGLHEDAKKLMGMMAKKGGAQRPTASSKNAVKKADPAKVMAKPTAKKAASSAKSKIVPEKARKASMAEGVAKSAPKSKIMSANTPEKAKKSMSAVPTDKYPKRRVQIAKELEEEAGKAGFEALERDLPKAGAKMALHEESAAAKAAGKGAFDAMKNKVMTNRAGKMVAGGLMGGMIAPFAGHALGALVESLDAEDSNPAAHDAAAVSASKRYAAENPRFDMGKVAPRAQLQSKLPSEVKKPQMRQANFTADAVESNPDQAKMENDFAKELKKWPR